VGRPGVNQPPSSQLPHAAVTVADALAQALSLYNAGRYDEARTIGLKIKRLAPSYPEIHNLLGAIEHGAGNSTAAVACFRKVLQLKPDHNEARTNLANVHGSLGQWKEAAMHFAHLAATAPPDLALLMNLANAEAKAGEHDRAIATYRRAMTDHPEPHIVQTDVALLLVNIGRHAQAEQEFKNILARKPGFFPALINLAVLCDLQGRMDDALRFLEEAVGANPENPEPHFHYALALLARERLAEGWAHYDWRLRRPQSQGLQFACPYWAGEPIHSRRMLLWTEQGPGDELLLASMLPDLIARGAVCTLICSQRLAPVFRRSFPEITLVLREDVLNGTAGTVVADYQASLSQLGLYLRPTPAAFPATGAYIKPDAALTAEFRHRYQGSTADRLVGIAWRSANPVAEAEKSTALAAWSDILRTPGARFVSLQYGSHAKEIDAAKKATGAKIIVDSTVDALTDMDRFAAQVAAMDLVISVSNTTVHVAGSMGMPVWTLVPASKGRIWYWFLERTDSPWYPTMRLFRQSRGTDWTPVLQDVARTFKQWSSP
jgi:tetratricopeptide (TPR) repeat protein